MAQGANVHTQIETGGPKVQGYAQFYGKFKTSPGYLKPCLKNQALNVESLFSCFSASLYYSILGVFSFRKSPVLPKASSIHMKASRTKKLTFFILFSHKKEVKGTQEGRAEKKLREGNGEKLLIDCLEAGMSLQHTPAQR